NGTAALIRINAASEKVKVKTSSVKENFVTGSLNTRAMMRGVSAALASWTATSSAVQTKTMEVNSAEAIVPSTARAVSGSTGETQPHCTSTQCSNRTAPIAATVLSTGRTQMELAR